MPLALSRRQSRRAVSFRRLLSANDPITAPRCRRVDIPPPATAHPKALSFVPAITVSFGPVETSLAVPRHYGRCRSSLAVRSGSEETAAGRPLYPRVAASPRAATHTNSPGWGATLDPATASRYLRSPRSASSRKVIAWRRGVPRAACPRRPYPARRGTRPCRGLEPPHPPLVRPPSAEPGHGPCRVYGGSHYPRKRGPPAPALGSAPRRVSPAQSLPPATFDDISEGPSPPVVSYEPVSGLLSPVVIRGALAANRGNLAGLRAAKRCVPSPTSSTAANSPHFCAMLLVRPR